MTDIRGLTSNVATVTVDIQSTTTCAADVTASSVEVSRRINKKTGATHTLTLSNASTTTVAGPVAVMLDSLAPAGTTLTDAAGVTSCNSPADSPYVVVDVGTDGMWSPGERVQVVLEFSPAPVGRGKKPKLSYTYRVLAGPGER